jgi:ubiquinone/menaquinone biosynthesis C-methylase UbiE
MTLLDELRKFLVDFHERYPGGTAESLRLMSDAQGRNSYRALADALLENSVEAPRLLDLGCGDGAFLAEVAALKPAAALSGIDLTASDVELAKKRCPTATLYVGDFTTFPFEPNSFDLVASHLVLMLSGPLEPVLAQVQRVLTPGGTFAFVVDDLNAAPGRYAELMKVAMNAAGVESATTPFRPAVDRRLYERNTLAPLLAQYGLRMEIFAPHVLCGDFALPELWEMFRRMYQIGTLTDDQRQDAKNALAAVVGSGACQIVLPFEIVVARRAA